MEDLKLIEGVPQCEGIRVVSKAHSHITFHWLLLHSSVLPRTNLSNVIAISHMCYFNFYLIKLKVKIK